MSVSFFHLSQVSRILSIHFQVNVGVEYKQFFNNLNVAIYHCQMQWGKAVNVDRIYICFVFHQQIYDLETGTFAGYMKKRPTLGAGKENYW